MLTLHTYIPLRETLFCPSLLFALQRHGHAESWLRLNGSASLKRFLFAQSRRVRLFAFIHQGACAPGSLWLYFGSRRDKWTSGSRSLLCQRFRRRCEEMAWKRKRIETSPVIVMVMLSMLTYIVSYKLFWNWIGVVQFVSHSHNGPRTHECCSEADIRIRRYTIKRGVEQKTNL